MDQNWQNQPDYQGQQMYQNQQGYQGQPMNSNQAGYQNQQYYSEQPNYQNQQNWNQNNEQNAAYNQTAMPENWQQPNVYQNQEPGYDSEPLVPEEYRPISMWGYLGYELLFAIPIVGLIMLLINAFGSQKNKNVKNFARSYLCMMVIAIAVSVVFSVVGGAAFLAMMQ